MTNAAQSNAPAGCGLEGVHPNRLFVASCMSLVATAICFAVIGDIMGTLKTQFILTNEQVGWIGGAALWGFTISIFVLGPLCDALGMRNLMRFAFICHLAGVIIMVAATGFWMLFIGALVLALGNGTVEAACNPLVATIYPDRKTQKLNQFHMWFPGGIVIGGLAAYAISQLDRGLWQLKLGVILVPTAIYGLLFAGQKFPLTERVQSGISFSGMVAETLGRPLFLVLFVCMMITASLELGPGRWVPAVLEAGGIAGILVLCYINGLMAILRYFAGPVVHRLSNTGVLLISAILAGVGLLGLSYSTTTAMAFATATVFALGVCYFWPTMLGTVAERVPKGGALALALMGGIGMAAVGLVTSPQMGKVADKYLHQELVQKKDQTSKVLAAIAADFPAEAAKAPNDVVRREILEAAKAAGKVLAESAVAGLPQGDTANALRAAIRAAGDSDAAKQAKALLLPADNHGGLMSFRYVAPFAVVLVVVFGVLYARDRATGVKPAGH